MTRKLPMTRRVSVRRRTPIARGSAVERRAPILTFLKNFKHEFSQMLIDYWQTASSAFYQASKLKVVVIAVSSFIAIAIISNLVASVSSMPKALSFINDNLIITLFDKAEAIATFSAVVLYLKGEPDRQRTELSTMISNAMSFTNDQVLGDFLGRKVSEGISLATFDFSGIESLKGIRLRRADLRDTNFHGVDLQGADLQGADLQGADLEKANLSEINLYEVDMRGAKMREVVLLDANLYKADLREADLSGAILGEADLTETDLRGANLSDVNLSQARFKDTTMPDGTVWNKALRDLW